MRYFLLSFTLFLTVCSCQQSNLYNLVLHSQERGAACLDGSPPGMYINEGFGANKTKYMFFFEGGGFCGGNSLSLTLESCYQRSKTSLGSTTLHSQNLTLDYSGFLSTKQSVNPHFYDWTKVIIIYCDGSSHMGHRDQPISYKDRQLYMRGSRNTLEQFWYMDKKYDFYNGDVILVSGGSAGGIAAFEWANYVKQNTKKAKVFSMPDSGLLMTDYVSPIDNKNIIRPYLTSLLALAFENQSQLAEPVRKCLQKSGFQKNYVSCFNCANYGQFITVPTLVIQSPYDAWSIANVGGVRCLSSGTPQNLSNCTTEQITASELFKQQAIRQIKSMKQENGVVGAWGPACVQHCFAQYSALTSDKYRVPSQTGMKLDQIIGVFLDDPSKTPWLMEEQAWPKNTGCNGLSSQKNMIYDE